LYERCRPIKPVIVGFDMNCPSLFSHFLIIF
jgi:hypothetical protein